MILFNSQSRFSPTLCSGWKRGLVAITNISPNSHEGKVSSMAANVSCFFFKARKCFSLDFSGGWKIRNHMLICLHTWPDFSFPWENGRTGTRACERGRIFLSELLLVLTGAPTLWQHNGKVPLQSTHQSTHYTYESTCIYNINISRSVHHCKVSIFKVIQQVVIEADRFSREKFVPSDPDWGCFAVATSCLNLKCPKTSSACQRWERYIQSRCPCRWSGAWRQRFHRRTDYAPVKLCLSWMPLRQTALCCNCIAACYIVTLSHC